MPGMVIYFVNLNIIDVKEQKHSYLVLKLDYPFIFMKVE